MGAHKGTRNNPSGRPKGSRNERSLQWDELRDAIIGVQAVKFNRILNELEGKKFIDAYTSVLGYFKPRLQSTSIDANIDSKPIQYINISKQFPEEE